MSHVNQPVPADRPRHRVLVDLSHAADGYVGIAQDTRLIFDMLASLPGVEASGLLMPTGRHDLPNLDSAPQDELAMIAGVLHWMARNWATRDYGGPLRRFRFVSELRRTLRSQHELIRVKLPERSSAIWRILLEKTLPPERRQSIMHQPFLATDLSVMRIIDRTMLLPFLAPKKLDAKGFDFVFFCMPRPVRLPPGVQQLVRFHDAVPITDVDTVEQWRMALSHQRLVRLCDPGATFICNSPQSVQDLTSLDPSRAARAHVIPCAIAPAPEESTDLPLHAIVALRQTFRAVSETARSAPPGYAQVSETEPTRFILAVSTLEPRKNYIGLIRAWERVISRSAPDLRLVIVANKGWREDEILRAMAPHVAAGRIIHLQSLPYPELMALTRQAVAFVFPSFAEGFGYPPLEALQAGTPAIVSDIPVFRWIFEDAVLYADPYEPESFADAIERLTVSRQRQALRDELMSRAPAVVARFTPGTVREQWGALLDELHPAGVVRAAA
jgi:glycosyltransferase involved in cell wall biosynthesis